MAVLQGDSNRPPNKDCRLDLSFARFEHDAQVTMLPPDLAVLLVGVAARQALSPTARTQVGIERRANGGGTFAPAHGAFSRSVAGLLAGTAPAALARPRRPKP